MYFDFSSINHAIWSSSGVRTEVVTEPAMLLFAKKLHASNMLLNLIKPFRNATTYLYMYIYLVPRTGSIFIAWLCGPSPVTPRARKKAIVLVF